MNPDDPHNNNWKACNIGIRDKTAELYKLNQLFDKVRFICVSDTLTAEEALDEIIDLVCEHTVVEEV